MKNWAASEERPKEMTRRLKSRITFDYLSAIATLPLVRRIVADLVEATRCFARANRVSAMSTAKNATGSRTQLLTLFQVRDVSQRQQQTVADQIDELRRLGVVVLDNVRGIVAFPSIVNGCLAYLIFQHGNDVIEKWRFRDQANLRPIPGNWGNEA